MADGLQISAVRSLDAQAIFQQAVLAADMAARQRERELSLERSRHEDIVPGLPESQAAEGAGLDLNRREMAARDALSRRYKMVWKAGAAGPGIVLDQPRPQGPGHHVDLSV